MGRALGVGLAGYAFFTSFKMLFLDKDWIQEVRRLGRLAAYRLLWLGAVVLTLVFCVWRLK